MTDEIRRRHVGGGQVAGHRGRFRKARELREGFRKNVHELLVPELFSTEVANVLLIAERKGRILAC